VPASAIDRKWMKGSPLKGALLALLLELDEPAIPWKLATSLERRLGSVSGIDRDAVYKMLPILARQDLAACTIREDESSNYRQQKVYGPTELTELAVSDWIAAPVSDEATRAELQVRIAFSRPFDAPILLPMLDMYERRCMERRSECNEEVPMSSWVGVSMNAARSWTKAHLDAELLWTMRTRDLIRDYLVRWDVAQR
jgi:hypothetical protein